MENITPPPPEPSTLPRLLFFSSASLKLLLGFFLGWRVGGGAPQHAAALHCSSCHVAFTRGRWLFFILLININVFIWCSCISPPHLSLPPSPSSLCILDHFLSFQVSGPVEADYPSPGGAGPPHCLRSVSLSLCSRYAHSPHPVCVGRWGRGAGGPQVCCRGHLLQQQTLTVISVSYTWHHSDMHHTHTHTCSTCTTAHCSTGSQQHVSTQRDEAKRLTDRQVWVRRAGAGGGGGSLGVCGTHTFMLWTQNVQPWLVRGRLTSQRPRMEHREGPSF